MPENRLATLEGSQNRLSSWILPCIVLSQFLCTSLWFAGNAVIPDLVKAFHFTGGIPGHLTSAVQFGFISGTLVYAILGVSDRFSPSKVFFVNALLASAANISIVIMEQGLTGILLFRFLTGFFLAGIYPVGMKIASDHYGKVLGKALGFLVGALVIGTSLPHLIKNYSGSFSWRIVFIVTSALSVIGGLIMFFLPDGAYRKKGQGIRRSELFVIFRDKQFRAASFGYFGHMWELYAFWAFVPLMLSLWVKVHPLQSLNISVCSFIIIAGGSIACVASGFISQKIGSRNTAFAALAFSALCCCISPFMFTMPKFLFIAFMLFWGLVVIADSPMFSTLVAQNAPPEAKGTALTFVTCIGFSITIVSIELINALKDILHAEYLFLFLTVGPLLGLIYMWRKG